MNEIVWEEDLPFKFEDSGLSDILDFFIKKLGYEGRNVSLCFCADATITDYNEHYRKKATPTDILAWSYWEEDPDSQLLGELMVSLETAAKQALQNGWDLRTEVIRLLAHGCAHLVGYDHERSEEEEHRMLTIEKELLGHVGLPHLYP